MASSDVTGWFGSKRLGMTTPGSDDRRCSTSQGRRVTARGQPPMWLISTLWRPAVCDDLVSEYRSARLIQSPDTTSSRISSLAPARTSVPRLAKRQANKTRKSAHQQCSQHH